MRDRYAPRVCLHTFYFCFIFQIIILISDGHGQDWWNVVVDTGARLQASNADLFAVTTSVDYSLGELLVYAGDSSRVFVGPTKARSFIPTISQFVSMCMKATHGIATNDPWVFVASSTLRTPALPSNNKVAPIIELQREAQHVFVSVQPNDIQPPIMLTHTSPSPTHAEPTSNNECNVDVVFIIDRSQSVVEEFDQQLAFAVDLVRRVPERDFTGRINIAAVSFERTAKLV